jgi:hypothetical protein
MQNNVPTKRPLETRQGNLPFPNEEEWYQGGLGSGLG